MSLPLSLVSLVGAVIDIDIRMATWDAHALNVQSRCKMAKQDDRRCAADSVFLLTFK
jgi:hypothetical protein